MNEELLKAELRADEGERLVVYPDHLGFLTIGVGHLIDPLRGADPAPFGIDLRKGYPITRAESSTLLSRDIAAKMAGLDAVAPWWRRLSDNRQRVVMNMAFQLGVAGFMAFKKAVAAMQVGDYEKAAREMAVSKWHNKDTPARAKRLIARMRAG